MAGKRIDELPVADGLNDDGLLVVYQDEKTQSITGEQIKQFTREYVETEAAEAEKRANGYTDNKIAAIPTPDVSRQINTHNTDTSAHNDIRQAVSGAEGAAANAQRTADSKENKGVAAAAVSTHNAATDAHNDIRLLIEGLTARMNALANSDDTTLDQMAEVVAYIKANRNLIEQITTGKVSVSEIVDNLTTNVANRPLSAAQGVALKTLIDGITASLSGHAGNISNPHKVTKAQVGLGAVDNTSDADKPVSTAQATAIAAAKKAGTDAQTALTSHNTNTAAHNDLRAELKALSDRVNAALDSDDTTLDELSEIVAYIKSNKALIDAITISKVNVTDIVNDLGTNVANKPLSAAQGVVLKETLDVHGLDIDTLKSAIAAIVQAYEETADNLRSHTEAKDNPHSVTAAQVGAPTVKQMNDAIAAASLGGGGGTGGGASSWKDLGEGVGEGVLLEETTLTETSTQIDKELGLVVGETYTVKWNGEDYTPTAVDASPIASVDGAVLLGMSSKYPFTILAKPGNGVSISIDSGSAPVTVSITGLGNTIIPIPGEYLPKGTPWIGKGEMAEIWPETTVQFSEGYESSIAGTIPMLEGETYIVRWNGTEYACVALDVSGITGSPAVLVGNGESFGMAGNSEPFCIVSVHDYGAIILMALDDATEAVFSVYQNGEPVHKLDNRCLDLAWLPTTEVVETEMLPEMATSEYVNTLTRDMLPLGTKVAVVFDGVRSEWTVKTAEGSPNLLYFGATTGVSWCFMSMYENYPFSLDGVDDGEHTVAVYKVTEEYNVIPDGFLGNKRADIINLTDLGLPCVDTNTTETLTTDTSAITKVLALGGKVALKFAVETRSADNNANSFFVTAVMDGCKYGSIYCWSTVRWGASSGLFAFTVEVYDTAITVTNRRVVDA